MDYGANRVSLVTGGTDGIGRAVALQLAGGGDRVLVVGRNAERGAQVLAELRRMNPWAEHAFIRADLSLLTETARLAREVARRTHRLDAVVLCAGILSTIPEWTVENLERSFVLNYLTRYLLARLLLPALIDAPSGRLVLVSNAGRYKDTLNFDDLQHRYGAPGFAVAGRTQFANDLLATELAARVRDTRVQVSCVYPGIVRTDVFRNARGLPRVALALLSGLQRIKGVSPQVAAQTPVFLAQDPEGARAGGRFYGPNVSPLDIPARARRPDRRRILWSVSEELVRPYLRTMTALRERAWPYTFLPLVRKDGTCHRLDLSQ